MLNRFRSTIQFFSRPAVSIITVFILSFVLSATISTFKKPVPRIHDEFSYLLAADTFSQGRLTNQTHPFWKHFQSFHIIHKPTYASKYPPGQGLFMAAGQVMTGDPLVGVWLSIGLASAAICWMLQAWVPPHWAFAGGLLSIIHPTFIFWGQNFWGGAVAVLGGSLLFGALRRMLKKPQAGAAFLMGGGIFLLAISRPFEGCLTTISAVVLLFVCLYKQRVLTKQDFVRTVLGPLGFSAIFILSALAYYNWSVTGIITRLPYQVYEESYATTPVFVWGSPRELHTRHPHVNKFNIDWSLHNYKKIQDTEGYIQSISMKANLFFVRLFAFPLWILLLMLPWIIKDQWGKYAVSIVLIILLVELTLTIFFQIHYLASVIPLIVFLLIQGIRYWRVARWKDHSQGTVFLLGLIIIYFTIMIPQFTQYLSSPHLPSRYQLGLSRSRLIEQLKQMPEKDLIFVKYSADHNPHFDWVYNRADIDNSEIVWALPLGNAENQKLINYFSDRKVWQLSVTPKDLKLTPYQNVVQEKQRGEAKQHTEN
ncbi:hypothetical protein [Gimesia algae]|uniref:hypothetical protein n=1 Tax=Gimesia algae TaxID=2527971 RepID=UPI0011A89588|nr:hypothetical protein [Gimesia algae]